MLFQTANIKSVKADLAKGEITVSFVVDIDQENMETAHALAVFADNDAGDVEVTIHPRQLRLNLSDMTVEGIRAEAQVE